MDKNILMALGAFALVFLFILPPWHYIKPALDIKSATLSGDRLTFDMDFAADWPNSCYIVVYGPFAFDKAGHEEGNNIYVLSRRSGSIADTLVLQEGANLTVLRAELWCDHDKLAEASKSI